MSIISALNKNSIMIILESVIGIFNRLPTYALLVHIQLLNFEICSYMTWTTASM